LKENKRQPSAWEIVTGHQGGGGPIKRKSKKTRNEDGENLEDKDIIIDSLRVDQ